MPSRVALLVLASVLALVGPASATDVDLDLTWGDHGVTTAVMTEGNAQLVWAYLSSALDVRGTLWVSGISAGGPAPVLRNRRAQDPGPFLIRFRTDGRLDRRLSRSGIVRATQAPWLRHYSSVELDVALRDGDIVGRVTKDRHTELVRIRPDATVDRSFGLVPLRSSHCILGAGHLMRVAGGFAALSGPCPPRRADSGVTFAVARFTARGRVDRSFGDGGVASVRVSRRDAGALFAGPQLLPLKDGGFAVAGSAGGGDDQELLVARFDRRGKLDRGFGTNGVAHVARVAQAGDFGGAAVLQDGAIVVDACVGA